ncbi:MAG: FtsQ-type POTRA domain-containing protein [Rickettsia sp.]|nr:FtsQ-type POTRA domain-containing protein [Rickettsia sp.]
MKNNFSNNVRVKRKILKFYLGIRYFFIILFVIFLLLFFVTDLLNNYKLKIKEAFITLTAQNAFVLEEIYVENLTNLTLLDLQNLLAIKKYQPILSLNLSQIQRSLKSHPLIKNILIERRLPNILYISIQEDLPIAIWQFQGKISLINNDANIIDFHDISRFQDLTYILGEDANLYAKELINHLNLYPQLKERLKYAIRIGKRRWDLIFDNDIKVKMPEKDFLTAYNYLNKFFLENKFGKKYKTLDLRNHCKFYFKKD